MAGSQDQHDLFKAGDRPDLPKYYVLDMFPILGSGLHVGHTEGYTASDIVARHKRMKGFDVLHPMGFDAFGLPAEQYAIDKVFIRNFDPENIETFGHCVPWATPTIGSVSFLPAIPLTTIGPNGSS